MCSVINELGQLSFVLTLCYGLILGIRAFIGGDKK